MLTPLRAPVTPAERMYNKCHILTRNTIERTIGVLKSRFGCLSHKLRYEPAFVGNIFVACVILHNIAISGNDVADYQPDPQVDDFQVPQNPDASGNATRRLLVDNFFVTAAAAGM
jgi:hypothetical protein